MNGGNNNIVNLHLGTVSEKHNPDDVGKLPLPKDCDKINMIIDKGPSLQTQEHNVEDM